MRHSSSKHPCKFDVSPLKGKCSQTNALRNSIGPDLYDRIMQWNDSGAVAALETARGTMKDVLNCKNAQKWEQEELSPISVLDISRKLDADEVLCRKDLQLLDAYKQGNTKLEFSESSYPAEFVHYNHHDLLHESVASEIVSKSFMNGHRVSTTCAKHPHSVEFCAHLTPTSSADDKKLVTSDFHILQADQPSLSSHFKSDQSKSNLKTIGSSFGRLWKRIADKFSKKS